MSVRFVGRLKWIENTKTRYVDFVETLTAS